MDRSTPIGLVLCLTGKSTEVLICYLHFFFFLSKPAASPLVFEAEDNHPGSPCPLPALQISYFILEVHLQQPQTQGWMRPALSATPETQPVTAAQVLMLINYSGMQPPSRLGSICFSCHSSAPEVCSGPCFQQSGGRTMWPGYPKPKAWSQPWQGHRLSLGATLSNSSPTTLTPSASWL